MLKFLILLRYFMAKNPASNISQLKYLYKTVVTYSHGSCSDLKCLSKKSEISIIKHIDSRVNKFSCVRLLFFVFCWVSNIIFNTIKIIIAHSVHNQHNVNFNSLRADSECYNYIFRYRKKIVVSMMTILFSIATYDINDIEIAPTAFRITIVHSSPLDIESAPLVELPLDIEILLINLKYFVKWLCNNKNKLYFK